MKKILSALTAVAMLSVATGAMATIVGSGHDLSSTTNVPHSNNTDQICVFCHTPHNPARTRALWNRNNPNATYGLYTSGANEFKLAWTGGVKNLPVDSPSMMCMSCHDGTQALGAVKVPPILTDFAGTRTPITMTGPNSLSAFPWGARNSYSYGAGPDLTADGMGLSNDHPISFIYDVVWADQTKGRDGSTDGKLIASVAGNATAKVIAMAPGLTADGSGELPLPKGLIECTTCHAVHDATYPPFLRGTMTNSALCLACHNK